MDIGGGMGGARLISREFTASLHLRHAAAFFLLNSPVMKTQVWNSIVGTEPRQRPQPARRKSVAAILRAAYRRYAGDAVTRRAVRRCLPGGV